MSNVVLFLIGLIVFLDTSGSSYQVLAECENYWLEQYEDVLPTINNRPDFPDSLTDGFQVKLIYFTQITDQTYKFWYLGLISLI